MTIFIRRVALMIASGAAGTVRPDRVVDDIVEHSAIVLVDRSGRDRYERASSSRATPAGRQALVVVDVASGVQRRIRGAAR